MSEPFEEAPPETAAPALPREPGHPHAKPPRFGIIARIVAMTVLVVLFALLFSTFMHRSTASGGVPPTPTVPAGWERYADQSGLFTLSIPQGWTVQHQSSTGVEGSSHGSVTFQETMDAFGGPPGGEQSITVWILVQPLASDLARQVMCDFGLYKHANATLAGLPAWYDGHATWIVESSGAHFQIDYAYPNDKGDVLIPTNAPSPTPMPRGFYEQGQQDWHTLLASFLPTPDTPLRCP